MTELSRACFSWAANRVSAFSKDVSEGLFSQTSFRGGGFSIGFQLLDGTAALVLLGQSEQRH